MEKKSRIRHGTDNGLSARLQTLRAADEAVIKATMDELFATLPEGDRTILLQEQRIRELGEQLGIGGAYREPDDAREIRARLRTQATELIVYRHRVLPARWRHLGSGERPNGRNPRGNRPNGRKR